MKKNVTDMVAMSWEVEPGVVMLRDVSVKGTGRNLTKLYAAKRKYLIEPFAEMVREGELWASEWSGKNLLKTMKELERNDALKHLSEAAETHLYNSYGASIGNNLAVAKADIRYDKAWRRLIMNLETSSQDIKRELGREIRIAYGYGWSATLFPELLFSHLTVTATWQRYSREKHDYDQYGMLTLLPTIRRMMAGLFFGPESWQPQLCKTLPKESGLTIENYEPAMATDLMTLDGVALNGHMLSDNGSISAAAVKRVKKQTPISNFAGPEREWHPDRVEMLCLTYFTLLPTIGKNAKTGVDVERLAKFATEKMPTLIAGPIFNTFLPALQGFLKTWTVGSYALQVARTAESIVKTAQMEWLSLDNFRLMLLCSNEVGEGNYVYLNLFADRERERAKLARRIDKDRGISNGKEIDWFEEVGFRFAVNWLKYLCALGIIEVATDTEAAGDDPMEGMRYARLTGLGRYVFGFDTHYTPQAAEGSLDVEYDAKNSILTVGDKSPFQMFLDNAAKRISPTRFKISSESLLKGCRTKAELEQKIKNLSVIIDPENEPALQEIIDNARHHTDCAQRDGGYSLLRLRPDLPGLRDTILTNFELRQMTILAGPTLALVKTHKLDRFNTILAAYGYLME